MVLISLFLILLLTLSITSENQLNNYSIDSFKDVLKEEGIFQVIESIKKAYGQDVAIISCEEIVGKCKGNCKRLVTEYISPSISDKKPKSQTTTKIGNSGSSPNSGVKNSKFAKGLIYSIINLIEKFFNFKYFKSNPTN